MSGAMNAPPPDLDLRFQVAETVIREAGRVASDYFARRASLYIDCKGAQDLVSEADRACEERIIAGLSLEMRGFSVRRYSATP